MHKLIAVLLVGLACSSSGWSQVAVTVDEPQSNVGDSSPISNSSHELGTMATLEQLRAARSQAEESSTTVLSVEAAKEPVPPLRFRLWKPNYELQPGSAQLHFYRALTQMYQLPSEYVAQVEDWAGDFTDSNAPSSQQVEQALEDLAPVFNELAAFAECEDRKWDHRLRDLEGAGIFEYRMPDVQVSRSLARLLQVKIRHAIRQGELEAAIADLQTGFRLAEFVGQGETLIQQLVGLAIDGVMLGEVEALLQADDCPNLYWALASLPRPLLDINQSIQFELDSIPRVFPGLAEAVSSENNDPEYWTEKWAQVIDQFGKLGSDTDLQASVAFLGALDERSAREQLLAVGMPSEKVDAMPALRAILAAGHYDLQLISQEILKSTLLPHRPGSDMAEQQEAELQQWIETRMPTSIAAHIVSLLTPAVNAAQQAGQRLQFMRDRLMTVEALRMHAAHHDGKFPASLAEITLVPVLSNPFTEQPLQYSVSDDRKRCTLTAPLPARFEFMKSLQLELR